MSIEAMKQALEALEFAADLISPITENCQCQICLAHAALRQAIEQAEDEPRHISYACPNCHWSLDKQVRTHTPEDIKKIESKWVGLTHEEVKYLVRRFDWRQPPETFSALIEAKLKEKNYG